jgi:hypothetical protein
MMEVTEKNHKELQCHLLKKYTKFWEKVGGFHKGGAKIWDLVEFVSFLRGIIIVQY